MLFLCLLASQTPAVSASSSELLGHRGLEVKAELAEANLLSANVDVVGGGEADKGDGEYAPRTATGGIINTLMVILTIVSFIGNFLFLVYVFWLSK